MEHIDERFRQMLSLCTPSVQLSSSSIQSSLQISSNISINQGEYQHYSSQTRCLLLYDCVQNYSLLPYFIFFFLFLLKDLRYPLRMIAFFYFFPNFLKALNLQLALEIKSISILALCLRKGSSLNLGSLTLGSNETSLQEQVGLLCLRFIQIQMNNQLQQKVIATYIYIFYSQLQSIQFAQLQSVKNIQMIDEEIQVFIEQYKAKMEEIAENQQFLPIRYFQEAQYIIRSQILQSIKSQDSFSIVDKTLIQWKNELYSRNQKAIANWCKEILMDSTNSVDKKIGRQIKSFNTYRQEIQMAIQFLRKKTEAYSTIELSTFIYQFIVQKILQNTCQLNTLALAQLQDQFKIIQIQNKALIVQCKQVKRKVAKEDNEAQRVINQLRQTLRNLQNQYDLLEQNHQQLKKECQQIQQNKEEKNQRITEQSNAQLALLRQLLENCREKSQQADKKSTFLQMQLKKQQLLHKQTMLHYQQLVQSYHSKQEELKEEILQVSRVSQKEIDQFKILSSKRLQDWQQTATELQQKLLQTEQILRNKDAEINALRQQLIAEKGKNRVITTDLNNQVMELQLKNRVLQQKQTEFQHIKVRVQKGQIQVKRIQKDRQHLNQLCKQYEKQKLIAQQKYQYLKAQIEQQQAKNNILTEQVFKKESQIIQRQNSLQKQQTINTLVQTDPIGKNEILKKAIELLQSVEGDWLKMKTQQRIKKRL